jgi:hypothetical protein
MSVLGNGSTWCLILANVARSRELWALRLMNFDDFLTKLGYSGSPQFLRRGDGRFESEPGLGHIFRRGEDKNDDKNKRRWRVEGVYGLRDTNKNSERFVPIVYVCRADDGAAAHELHKKVWNQDVVPYVLVHEPSGVRVYAGFHFDEQGKTDAQRGIIQALTDFDRVESIIKLFAAATIDDGKIWQNARLQIDPSRRVYHQLLHNLSELDKWLRGDGGLKKDVSHALIGKYVYLRYLRDRNILSNERLTEMWGIQEKEIFSGNATKTALEKLTGKLEDWLNGEIFPLSFNGTNAPTSDHVKRVAATFAGDEISGKNWQGHLEFQAYDFSYIPIETLSLIYEQFLHADEDAKKDSQKTKGRKAGAYYTPLPLVNFMLAELEQRHPLVEGMKICDPSSGSGAFLVQGYRRLIEKTFDTKKPVKASELKRVLQTSIFGVDLDGDACRVTELSLLLTLLDYVDPPDLTGKNSTFKLPTLHNQNIFEGDFFKAEPRLRAAVGKNGFDWIIGNPPWKQLKDGELDDDDKTAWDWMRTNAVESPVSMNQVAQAFAWAAPRFLADDGECGLLLPAMGLFEEPSKNFRQKFFRRFQVHNVANFANLAEVLFDGRSRVPAMAVFYRLRPTGSEPMSDEPITTYSPFVVNQEATCPLASGERRKLWSLVLNGSEVRTIELGDVATGSGLPWKLAMWGTPWDERLVRRLEKKWPMLNSLEANWHSGQEKFIVSDPSQIFCVSEGLQLRREDGEDVEPVDEVAGKWMLNVKELATLRDIFHFPKGCLNRLERDVQFYALKGRVKRPLTVCAAPHVIVSAARNFAVYSEDFIVVPARQIGIVSTTSDKLMLKALSLFLSSDFCYYHQFIRSSQFGIKRDVATLESLRQLPVPMANLSQADLKEWADLHAKLIKLPSRPLHPEAKTDEQDDFFEARTDAMQPLLDTLNKMTAQVLGLDDRECALVHDLVRVRFQLNDGKRGKEAMREPTKPEMRAYTRRLKQELDDFIGEDSDRLHRVTAVHDKSSAMVEIDFTRDHAAARETKVLDANAEAAEKLGRVQKQLRTEHAQWVYFNRNLRVYRGHQTYIFKPLQRFHWTESAAMMDASQIIAETLGTTD